MTAILRLNAPWYAQAIILIAVLLVYFVAVIELRQIQNEPKNDTLHPVSKPDPPRHRKETS